MAGILGQQQRSRAGWSNQPSAVTTVRLIAIDESALFITNHSVFYMCRLPTSLSVNFFQVHMFILPVAGGVSTNKLILYDIVNFGAYTGKRTALLLIR